jgi:LPXTG-motif cell wall-anchored protein
MKKLLAGGSVVFAAAVMSIGFAGAANAGDYVSPPTAPPTPVTPQTVVSAPEVGTSTPSTLPNTGGPDGIVLGGGAALLVAGGAAIVVARRRQTV